MKKILTKLTLTSVFASMLLGASAVSAQSAASDSNLSVEIGGTYQRMKERADGGMKVNLYGASLAFGWRIDERNKIQLETGSLSGDLNENGIKEEYFSVPLLFTYHMIFPLGNEGRFEFRLSPSMGVTMTRIKINDGSGFSSDSNFAFTQAIGAGFTFNITDSTFVNLGVRYSRLRWSDYKFYGQEIPKMKMEAYSGTITVGLRF